MDWSISILVHILELTVVYYLYCGFIDTKTMITFKKIIIAILWGVIMGTFATFLRYDIYMLIIHSCNLILIQLLYRKKIYNTLIVLLVIYALHLAIQILAILIISPLPIHDSIGALLAQTVTTSTILLICKKIPLYKVFKIIEARILLKLCIYLLNFITLSIIIYFNLSYEGVKLFVFYFLLLNVISIVGFIAIIYKIYYFTNKLPSIHHEVKNVLASIYISAYNKKGNNLNEIETYLKLLGMDVPIENTTSDEGYKNIHSFIQYKRLSNTDLKKIVFDTDICYFEPFEQVPEPAVMIMLAILLDNAMEASPSGKKIKILMHISEDVLIIEVANASKKRLTDLVKLFEKGKSTKKENNHLHGYGLFKLTEIVTEYQGEIFLESNFIKEEMSRYMFIRIEFRYRWSKDSS